MWIIATRIRVYWSLENVLYLQTQADYREDIPRNFVLRKYTVNLKSRFLGRFDTKCLFRRSGRASESKRNRVGRTRWQFYRYMNYFHRCIDLNVAGTDCRDTERPTLTSVVSSSSSLFLEIAMPSSYINIIPVKQFPRSYMLRWM